MKVVFKKGSVNQEFVISWVRYIKVRLYLATYVLFGFRKPFSEGSDDDIVIQIKMNQFRRCRIGSEVFGSSISIRHAKSSYILAKFITKDGTVDCYSGQVQYYFTHTVDLPNSPAEHFLAYVRWYEPVASLNVRYHFSTKDDDKTYNVELWNTEFYPIGQDCIIPVHHILSRFVPVNYRISTCRNAKNI